MFQSISRRSIFLILLDFAAIWIACSMGAQLHRGPYFDAAEMMIFPREAFFYLTFAVYPFVFYIFDLYYPYKHFFRAQTLIDALLSVGIGSVILASSSYFDKTFQTQRFVFIYSAVLLAIFVLLIRMLYDVLFQSRFLDKKVLILGTGPLAAEITELIKATRHSGIKVAGFVYEGRKPLAKKKAGLPIVGGSHELPSLIEWYKPQMVIMALDPAQESSETELLARLLEKHVMVTSALHLFEKIKGEIPHRLLGPHYLLGLMSQVKTLPYLKVKALGDFFIAFALLLTLFPVFIIAWVVTALTQNHDPFFFQKRIGRDGRYFRLIKLRTMTGGIKGKPVVTKVGRWIRRYRIDEIPQLINVLKGDMSLVGPRPEIPYFVNRCRKKIPFYDSVFAVRPGLTGWAQVMFHHTVTVRDYDRKFRYNLYYLKNISFTLDFLILLKTIRVVLLGKGK